MKNLVYKYSHLVEMTLFEMLDHVATLEATGMDSEELQDCLVIREFTLRQLALQGEAINEDYRDAVNFEGPLSDFEPDHFPREMFMDYIAPTPKFNVGDVVFKLNVEDEDEERSSIEEVVITCVYIDIFGVTYDVAPYDPSEEMCTAHDFEVEEDEMSFSRYELDPKRTRLQIVK